MEVERPNVSCLIQRLKDQEVTHNVDVDYECQKKQDQQTVCTNTNLSPNLQPPSNTVSEPKSDFPPTSLVADKYLMLEPVEGSTLYRCVDVHTQEELVCKVIDREAMTLLAAHDLVAGEARVNQLLHVVPAARCVYLMYRRAHGDLHTYVRLRRRLREPEARRLFRQMAEAVLVCHNKGIVLRDLKLRKFVFSDPEKTSIKLETLEDAVVLKDPEDDLLQDKRGCPAYVSPEILRYNASYSGRAADIWSLGVILYTMLVGRYPFNDNEHASLFAKITRGHFVIPESLTAKAKCLIRSLLRRDPRERLSASDILRHPWLTREDHHDTSSRFDQVVPGHD